MTPSSDLRVLFRVAAGPRRGFGHLVRSLSLARALGITTALTGSSLADGPIRIEDHGLPVDEARISVGPRVGIDYAEEDAGRPYRFRLQA